MNKIRHIIFLLSVLLLLIQCDTEKNIEPDFKAFFVKYYGGSGNQQGVDLAVNSDGTILLLGNTQVARRGNKFFVVRIDSTGTILASKNFGDADTSSDEVAVDIEPTFDGNYIIAIQKTIAPGNRDVKLLKISPDLIGLDSATRSFAGDEEIKSITPLLSNRGYVMTGSTTQDLFNDGQNDLTDVFTFRTDEDLIFDPLWLTPGGNGQSDVGVKIFERQLDQFDLFLSTNPSGTGGFFGFYYIGIDGAGNGQGGFVPISQINTSDEQLSQVVYDPLVGFALIGTSTSGSTPSVIHSVIVNSDLQTPVVNDGNQNISAGLSGELSGISIFPSKFGGFLALANQTITLGSNVDANLILIRLNARGQIQWSTAFGAEFSDSAAKVCELPDGKIMILGTETLGNQEKMMLIKVNAEGQFLR